MLTTNRFTGQYHESGLPSGEGLSYYSARWYDAQLGKFVSPDSVVPDPANPQALNRFAYVFNRPTVLVDPTGHDPIDRESRESRCQSYGNCGATSGSGRGSASPKRSAGYMPMKTYCRGRACDLAPKYDRVIRRYARLFGISERLLRTTQLVEAVDDQEWYSPYANGVIYGYALAAISFDPDQKQAGWTGLTLIEAYFRLRHPENGIGMENVHVQPAREAAAYLAKTYPGSRMARVANATTTMPDMLVAMKTVEGNTMYAAAILRQLADFRTGRQESHVSDLDDVDEAIIYSAYRAGVESFDGSPGGFVGTRSIGSYGLTYLRYLHASPDGPQ